MLCRLIAGVSAFASSHKSQNKKNVEANYFRQRKISQLKPNFGLDNVFAKLATNHCLKQWLCSCWHGYASNGHNELVTLLNHWGRVTHISVSKLIIISSDDGLSPGRRHAIIWTNARKLLFGPPGTNFSEILIQIHTFSFNKMHLKMSSGKWWPSLDMHSGYLTNKSNIIIWWSCPACFSPQCLITGTKDVVGEQWDQGHISYVISLLADVIVSCCYHMSLGITFIQLLMNGWAGKHGLFWNTAIRWSDKLWYWMWI